MRRLVRNLTRPLRQRWSLGSQFARVPAPPVSFKLSDIRGKVIICGLGPQGFSGPGKVQPDIFFQGFGQVLAEAGIAVHFANSARELSRICDKNSCVVHIYQETRIRLDKPSILRAQNNAGLVFNHPKTGPIIARKDLTNELLNSIGIPVPPVVDSTSDGAVFSNAFQDTKADALVVGVNDSLNSKRYNTRLIDTRVHFRNVEYYTSLRLMSVGRELVHAFVRARDVKEGSPSVHAFDTPSDSRLLNFLQKHLVEKRLSDLTDLSARLGDALGPGFYAHDVLVERNSGRLFVCETGYKFHDWPYTSVVSPVMEDVPSHQVLRDSIYPQRSAEAFLKECQRLGMFV